MSKKLKNYFDYSKKISKISGPFGDIKEVRVLGLKPNIAYYAIIWQDTRTSWQEIFRLTFLTKMFLELPSFYNYLRLNCGRFDSWQVTLLRPSFTRYDILFLVFMWRHHFPKPKNINLCEVLVLSDVRPSKNLTFEVDRVPHYVIEYVWISKFVRCVTLKCT